MTGEEEPSQWTAHRNRALSIVCKQCVLRESNRLKALISLTAVGLFCRRQLVNMPVWAKSVFVWARAGATVCIVHKSKIV